MSGYSFCLFGILETASQNPGSLENNPEHFHACLVSIYIPAAYPDFPPVFPFNYTLELLNKFGITLAVLADNRFQDCFRETMATVILRKQSEWTIELRASYKVRFGLVSTPPRNISYVPTKREPFAKKEYFVNGTSL